ncbi:TetR/AcrR family transcriptional regulator [Catellatospora sichuanensis]|uniref:TetR/AcrR family transcriptional regulator n=1 Tax=Catellatospora sichuanensis TaxID=1969805 RepID=UPI001C902BF3|nr:TetR/AcrR family transcriptional regulator [Catellatospora sichuanensis]
MDPRQEANGDQARELPAALAILWGRRERTRRGPKPALTVERIVEAAVQIADAEGLGPLSMGRLAEALGFTPMALYRYVGNKDVLLQLMADVAGGPPDPRPWPPGWRAGLRRWAGELFAMYRRHPWLLQVPMDGMPPAGPNGLLWLDAGLRCLAGTPLSAEDRLNVVTQLSIHVRGEAHFAQQYEQPGNPGAAGTAPTYGDLLRSLIDADRYPALSELLQTGVLDGPDAGQAEFDAAAEAEFGLGLMLDGIAALIEAHQRA